MRGMLPLTTFLSFYPSFLGILWKDVDTSIIEYITNEKKSIYIFHFFIIIVSGTECLFRECQGKQG